MSITSNHTFPDRRKVSLESDSLYIFGVPSRVGGASTKIAHLIRLLHGTYRIAVVLPHICWLKDHDVKNLTVPYKVPCMLLKDLPKKLNGIALAICERQFFSNGIAEQVKTRGLRLIWSNEMMFPFDGEAEECEFESPCRER